MKILSFDQFNEKLEINPINLSDIDSMPNALDVNVAVSKIKNTIHKYCTYNGMGKDGVPIHMGDLLAEFGYDCEWDIRDKEYDVDYINFEGKDIVRVRWVSQGPLDENSLECLRQMFEEMVKLSNVRNVVIVFMCGVRDNYYIGGNPEHTMVYNPKTNKVEL